MSDTRPLPARGRHLLEYGGWMMAPISAGGLEAVRELVDGTPVVEVMNLVELTKLSVNTVVKALLALDYVELNTGANLIDSSWEYDPEVRKRVRFRPRRRPRPLQLVSVDPEPEPEPEPEPVDYGAMSIAAAHRAESTGLTEDEVNEFVDGLGEARAVRWNLDIDQLDRSLTIGQLMASAAMTGIEVEITLVKR